MIKRYVRNRNVDLVNYWYDYVGYGVEASNYEKTLVMRGSKIYSYGLLIGERVLDDVIIYDLTAGGGRFVSVTTSRHVNMLKRVGELFRSYYNNIIVV